MAGAVGWYAGRGHAALVSDQLALLVQADSRGELVRALWPAVASGELPTVLTLLAALGMAALPGFVLVQGRPAGLLVFARGPMTAAVYRGAELLETVHAGDVTTWREQSIDGADRAILASGTSTSDAPLPLNAGVVEASQLSFTPRPATPLTAGQPAPLATIRPARRSIAGAGSGAGRQTSAPGTDREFPEDAQIYAVDPHKFAEDVAILPDTSGMRATGAATAPERASDWGGTGMVPIPMHVAGQVAGAVPADGGEAGVAGHVLGAAWAGGGEPAGVAGQVQAGGVGVGEAGKVLGPVTREWKEPVAAPPLAPGQLLDRLPFLDSAVDGGGEERPVVREAHYGDTVRGGRGQVAAVRCPKLHLNPPATPVCRECTLPLDPGAEPFYVSQPTVGTLRRADGQESWPLNRKVTMLGGAPGAAGLTASDDLLLVPLAEVSEAICAEVRLDGWRVEVIDRSERGGTLVTNPGDGPLRLEPGVPMRLLLGGQLRLAGEVILVFGL